MSLMQVSDIKKTPKKKSEKNIPKKKESIL